MVVHAGLPLCLSLSPVSTTGAVCLFSVMNPVSKDGGEASESSSVVGTGCSIGGDVGSSEQDTSAKGSAPSSPPVRL